MIMMDHINRILLKNDFESSVYKPWGNEWTFKAMIEMSKDAQTILLHPTRENCSQPIRCLTMLGCLTHRVINQSNFNLNKYSLNNVIRMPIITNHI